MKLGSMIAAGCIVALSAGAAMAADTYVGIGAGATFPVQSTITDNTGVSGKLDYKTGFGVSLVTGVEFADGIRLEAELNYKNTDMDKVTVGGLGSGKVNCNAYTLGALANAYFDFKNSTPVTPYLTGGLGFANIHVGEATNFAGTKVWNSDDDMVFAYQLGAGVGFNVTKQVVLDLGYRYYATSDPQFELIKGDFATHNANLGIRYKF